MPTWKPSTATNIIDQNALNNVIEFLDIASLDSVSVSVISTGSQADGTPPSAITSATQRIGTYILTASVSPRTHEDFGVGGTRIGQVTVFGDYSDTRNIDHLRQGKNVTNLKHFAKGTLPFISVNTGKVLCDNDGRVRHQMTSGHSFGQSSLYQVFDDRKRKVIPFEDFPGKLDPVAYVDAGDYIMQYMIVTDLTRDVDKFINPDTMDGVIEVFEIRRQFANTNFSDIQINGIRCDLSTGDWNFDQKGSSIIDTKYEKKSQWPTKYDYFEDAQDTLFSGHVYDHSGSFSAKLGFSSGSVGQRFINSGSHDRYFALPGFTSEGYYQMTPFSDSRSHIAASYEHVRYALMEEASLSTTYDLLSSMDYPVNSRLAYSYREANSLVAWWQFENKDITGSYTDSRRLVAQKATSGADLVPSGNTETFYPTFRPSTFSTGIKPSIHFPGDGTILFGPSTGQTPGSAPLYSGQNGYPTVLTASADVNNYSFGNGSADNSFTISAWVRWNNIRPGNSYKSVIIAKNDRGDNREWELAAHNTRIDLTLWDDSAAGGGFASSDKLLFYAQSNDSGGFTEFTNDVWHHIVVSYNGSATAESFGSVDDAKFYVDGNRVPMTHVVASKGEHYVAMEKTDARVSVGNYSRGSHISTAQFLGNIAEIAIWKDVELSESAVKTLYYAGDSSTVWPADTMTTKALNNVLTSSFFDVSDIGSRFTSAPTGFIFPKNIVSASNMSGINNHLGVDSIAFGGLLK